MASPTRDPAGSEYTPGLATSPATWTTTIATDGEARVAAEPAAPDTTWTCPPGWSWLYATTASDPTSSKTTASATSSVVFVRTVGAAVAGASAVASSARQGAPMPIPHSNRYRPRRNSAERYRIPLTGRLSGGSTAGAGT